MGVNKRLVKITLQKRSGRNVSLVPHIVKFLSKHVQATIVVMSVNRSNWVTMTFATSSFAFFTNTYIASILMLYEMNPIKFTFCLLLMSLQFSLTFLSFLALAYANRLFHRSKKILPSTQFCLKSARHLRIKLKLNEIYERLTSKRAYGTMAGPKVTITYFWMYKVALGYCAYFMSFIKFLRSEKDSKAILSS